MATLTSIGSALYDSGTTDPTALAQELVRKTGVSLLQALSAARGIVASKVKSATDTVTAPLDSLSDVAGVIKDAVDAPVRVIKWFTDPNTWLRIGYVVVGVAFLVLGARKLTEDHVDPIVEKVVGGVTGAKAKVSAAAAVVK